MTHKFSFEKLDVWHLSIHFVKDIYKVTNEFPDNEKFGLVSQINRASVSIASNIAEGTSRTSSKDQAHFTQLAYSSLMEVICQLIIAKELKIINDENFKLLRDNAEEIANKLNSLRNYQLKKSTPVSQNKSTNKRLNNSIDKDD